MNSTEFKTERHLAEELRRERMARQATNIYNASQHIVAALEQTSHVVATHELVEARSSLVYAHRHLEGIMRGLERDLELKPEGRRKGKPRGGEITRRPGVPGPVFRSAGRPAVWVTCACFSARIGAPDGIVPGLPGQSGFLLYLSEKLLFYNDRSPAAGFSLGRICQKA